MFVNRERELAFLEERYASGRAEWFAAFDPYTLRRFCYDRAALRPIVAQLAPDHGLNRMVELTSRQMERYGQTQRLRHTTTVI